MPKLGKYESFNVGDVVRYVGPSKWRSGEYVIRTAVFSQGCVEYSTNRGSWFDNDDFVLSRKADEESFKALHRDEEGEDV